MHPTRYALYDQCNKNHDWEPIAPVYFRCGFDQGDGPCPGAVKIEQGLINDPPPLFDCPKCGMLVDGPWAQEHLTKI